MPVKRRLNGKLVWFGRITFPGGRRMEKRCSSRHQAAEWEVTTRARLQDANTTPTESLSLAVLFERYLDHILARGVGRASYDEKRRVFRRFFSVFRPETPAVSVRYVAVESHLDRVAAESGHKANRHGVHIAAVYQWGIRAFGLPAPNPWRVPRYKYDKQPRYVPPIEDFWRVYDEAESWRQRLLLTFLHTAARMSEVFNIKWEDADMRGARLRLWTRKRSGGREYDWIPMTSELKAVFERQRLETAFKGHVFINPETDRPWASLSKMMPELCRKAGVRPFGFHAIRHLSASILAENGVPVPVISAILRHKNLTTTTRYLQSLQGVDVFVENVFDRNKKAPGWRSQGL